MQNLLAFFTLEQMLQALPAGLFLVDTDQHVTYWNTEAERLTGYPADQAIGQHCSFLAGTPCGRTCGLFDKSILKPQIGVLCTIKARDGRTIHLLKNVDSLRDNDGRIVGGMETFIDVTDLRECEMELRQEKLGLEQKVRQRTDQIEAGRKRLNTILDAMEDPAYIVNQDCRIEFANRAMKETFGSLKGKICHKTFFGFPSRCPWCPMPQILKGESVRQERFYESVERNFELFHSPLKGENGQVQKLAVFRDITEKKKAEKELASTKARLEHLLTTSPAIIYTAKAFGDFAGTFISENIQEQTGWSPENFTSDPLFWLNSIHPEDRERIRKEVEESRRKGHGVFEYRLRYSDGAYRWMRDENLLLRDTEGEPLEVVGCLINITERKEAEDRLLAVNRELDDFVRIISHDMRSPLTPIIGFAEFLRENYADRLDDLALEILGDIEMQGEKALELLDDLLELSQLGQLEPPAKAVSITRLVRQVLKELREPIAQANITVSLAPLPPLALPASLLSLVFTNLISNAVRYAGTSDSPIEVGGARGKNQVRYFVRDHGLGIPENERDRIFDLFFRGSTRREAKGTGIGLATVRKIMRLYQGRIWVEETPGGGSTFWIEFPLSKGSGTFER